METDSNRGIVHGQTVEALMAADAIRHDEAIIKEVAKQSKVKRTVIIHQLDDNSFNAEFSGISARQQILPMLKFAERNFRLRLARHEVS